MNKKAKQFVQLASLEYGEGAILTRQEISEVVNKHGLIYPTWFTKDEYRMERGEYKLPLITDIQETITESHVAQPPMALAAMVAQVTQLHPEKEEQVAIPELFTGYVPFGFHDDLNEIIKSRAFYPIFITGLSGNGKTLMVEQVCAVLGRECIRVNISIETDQSDLIGGPTLVNGNIVNRDGPVITAMRRGAILLIDEVDRGSNKLMCIQGIMEGKPYFNKNTGEVIHPAEGFNIIATANTKGRGSDEGRYLSQILDDAFLERFPITVEQEYPSPKVEIKILNNELKKKGLTQDTDKAFVKNLVSWAEVIRKTFYEGGVDEIIATRRLVHIVHAYSVFKDRMKAIRLCVARFDTDTKNSFLDLYTKVDVEVSLNKDEEKIDEVANELASALNPSF